MPLQVLCYSNRFNRGEGEVLEIATCQVVIIFKIGYKDKFSWESDNEATFEVTTLTYMYYVSKLIGFLFSKSFFQL